MTESVSKNVAGNGISEPFEIIFFRRRQGIYPPVEKMEAPTVLSKQFPGRVTEVGTTTKFVTHEYLYESPSEGGITKEIVKRLMGIHTMVRGNTDAPDHAEILRYLEDLSDSRHKVSAVLSFSGGKIAFFNKFAQEARAHEAKQTEANSRIYSPDADLRFDSDTIRAAKTIDHPTNPEEAKALMDRIKRALEQFAVGLEER